MDIITEQSVIKHCFTHLEERGSQLTYLCTKVNIGRMNISKK